MKFNFHVSPSIKCPLSTQSIMRDLTIGLGFVFTLSCIYYGASFGMEYAVHAITLLISSLITMGICESLFAKIMKKDIKSALLNSFGWVTSIILVMMCPITITNYAVVIATVFAIVFAKLLFGGFGQNIFNPAAVGRAVIMAAFAGASTSLMTGATPTSELANTLHWIPTGDNLSSVISGYKGFTSLFLGTYPGGIGETFTLAILLVGVVLSLRQVIDWRVPSVYLGTMAIMTAVIALLSGLGSYNGIPAIIWYPFLHICTGGAAFGAVFMLTDPVTSPTSAAGRTIFAMGAAILTVMIRLAGNLPEGCLYSILLMNMLTPMIESFLDGKQLEIQAKIKKCMICLAVVALGICFFCSNSAKTKQQESTAYVAQIVEKEAI
ncbi:MAG: RnfABCDGE type electron transport complex subunit D [Bacillota bacterium]|nr:RnfABCDGE type electron transport complex subunit D [Bacillota bacterium]